ncbi:MAG: RDD family protein [Planctomycetaceae bacterium]|nr:RDD family protein [Planctomycetaceae bacterium]
MSRLQFETPENVAVSYSSAGLGTRYVAWFVDQILVWFVTIVLIISMICAGASFEGVDELFREGAEEGSSKAILYIIGLMTLVWGLGSFVYFGASELFLRGQTLGKRLSAIRVVKADGFALDAQSILVRNIFRVVDHLPLLWIVPVLSSTGQRLGDMVAGTIVVAEENVELSSVRNQLAERSALESEFRFDATSLARLSEMDLHAVEQILERWNQLGEEQRQHLIGTMLPPLCQKLKVETPPIERGVHFLEDLLSAELRRQRRSLG